MTLSRPSLAIISARRLSISPLSRYPLSPVLRHSSVAELIFDLPLSLSSPSPSTVPNRSWPRPPTNPATATPLSPRHHPHTSRGRRGELATLVTRSWVIGAGALALPPALAGPDKIASMRRISTALSSEIAIWMTWTRTSGWWKNCCFPLLPPPNSLVGTPTSGRTVTRGIWRAPRWRLRQPCIPTVTSLPRTLSTSHSYSSCNSNKLRILLRLLPQSSVSSGSQPNSRPSLKHHNITTILISSSAPMMSTSTDADISDLRWLPHLMDRVRTCLPWWIVDREFDRRR